MDSIIGAYTHFLTQADTQIDAPRHVCYQNDSLRVLLENLQARKIRETDQGHPRSSLPRPETDLFQRS